jgi:cysteinyl-tRNA synthetase
MTLHFYNSLTRRKEPFTPLEPGKVSMYTCGVTVYNDCHIGHARSYINWDTVRRYLKWRGYSVRYVQNFTDVDDKILNRATERGTTMEAIANQYIDAYFRDIRRFNIADADVYPRATEHIADIIVLIQTLIDGSYAYAAGGDVYYRVQQFPWYGKLSGRKLDDMQAGASGRVDLEDPSGQKKQYPFDFALWKGAKPGEPFWESPWGKGRPGWHIECSAMIRSKLGETIDIHTGGGDLVFPHHENEIAQSEASTHKALANYWLHNGMVNVDGEKMSKSLNNFITIAQLLNGSDAPDPMAIRLLVLQAHYRKPFDLTDEAIASAQNSWNTMKEGLLFGSTYGQVLGWTEHEPGKILESYGDRFNQAMDDDINAPAALAVLFELAKDLRREGNILTHQGKTETDPQTLLDHWTTLVTLADVLGLAATVETVLSPASGLSDAEIETLIVQRQAAKQAKNFAESDRIRDDLKENRIVLIDKPGGVTDWHRA